MVLSPRQRLAPALVLVVLLFVLIDTGARLTYSGRALPGTTVAGIKVGGESEGDVRQALQAAADAPLLVRRTRTRIAPATAGVAWDVEATVEKARDAGRGGALLGIGSTLGSALGDREVAPVMRPDRTRLRRVAAALARRVDRAPNNGGFRVNGDTLRAEVRRPRAGRVADREALRRELLRAAASTRRDVEIEVRGEPAIPRSQVEAVARKAERYLRAPLVVTGGGRSAEIPASVIAPALTMTTTGRPRLSVPRAGLAPVLARIRAVFAREARPPRFGRTGRPVLLEGKGEESFRPRRTELTVTPGRAGRSVDERRAVRAIGDAIRAGRHRVRVRTRREQPPVTDAQARNVDSVIGTFTTRYVAGQPRVQNIQRIARSVDGTVVAPGAQFSLNAAAGERTRDKGYVEAPFIADGKIEPSIGGGVSQFSTTTYNAAYFAGLRLDSSQPHSLYIDRYPPGREATLNFPSIDLRWTNDTEAPVVIQADATDTAVTVTLLGDNGGRRVRAVPGERKPVEGGDFAITVTRIIRYPGGRELEQPRTTRYEIPVPE